MANATTGSGASVANNKPIGTAGQPVNPKMAAIKRRLAATTNRTQG